MVFVTYTYKWEINKYIYIYIGVITHFGSQPINVQSRSRACATHNWVVLGYLWQRGTTPQKKPPFSRVDSVSGGARVVWTTCARTQGMDHWGSRLTDWKKIAPGCSWVFCKIKMASISLWRFKFIRSKSSHGVFVQRNIPRAELKLNFVGDSGLRLRYEWWSTTSSVSQQITGKSYRLKGAFDRIC